MSFKMLRLSFSSKLDWGSSISSIAKTLSKKIGALVHSMKIPSPEVALYLYWSTIQPCMEYCCHVWVSAPNCFLEFLFKQQKQIYRTVGPSLATFLEALGHNPAGYILMMSQGFKRGSKWRTNSPTISLFYRCYFSRCSSELAQLVSLSYCWGRSTLFSEKLHDFSVTFLDLTRISMSTVSFLAQLDPGIISP